MEGLVIWAKKEKLQTLPRSGLVLQMEILNIEFSLTESN